MKRFTHIAMAACLSAGLLLGSQARAEVSELAVAVQPGISYLSLMIMQDEQLIEKHAKQAGIDDLKVNWSRFAGGNVMNEAVLSGSLHFASGGVGPLVTMWARTRGNLNVKAVSAINAMPLYLNSRNPQVKSIKDLTEKDKIALPAVRVSIQAVTLQMAAEHAFGEGQQCRLDMLMVSLAHPGGCTALLSGSSETTAHFPSPPFQDFELKQPGIHRILSSYEVLGGPATFNLVWTTEKFHKENPKVYAAFVAALQEATDKINKDKTWAAKAYLRLANDQRTKLEDVVEILNNPDISYTLTPNNIMKYVNFMHKVGSIKVMPDSWKDLFFPNAQTLQGS